MAVAPLDRLAVRGHGRHDLTTPQPFGAVVLIVYPEVEQETLRLSHGRDEPSSEAVRVDGNAQGHWPALGLKPRQILAQGAFEQRHLLNMLTQALTRLGRQAGLAPHHENGADPLLQQFDPLGDGRRSDVQLLGSLLEAARAHYGRERGQEGVIQHEISFSKSRSMTLTVLIVRVSLG